MKKHIGKEVKAMRASTIISIAIIATVAIMVAVPAFAAPSDFGLSDIEDSGLSRATNINDSIKKVIQWALGFAGAVAVVFIVYGGFRYTTSGGNSDAKKTAKDVILYAIIGLVVIIVAFVIVSTVVGGLT